MYFVNVDKPTNRTMVHQSECRFAQVRSKLKQDGEWSKFDSEDEAYQFATGVGLPMCICMVCADDGVIRLVGSIVAGVPEIHGELTVTPPTPDVRTVVLHKDKQEICSAVAEGYTRVIRADYTPFEPSTDDHVWFLQLSRE